MKSISSRFLFKNLQFCTGPELLFTERTLKTNFVMLCVQWIFIFVLDVNTYSQRDYLKQFRHDFCFTNILVCTGYEQLFTERTLKPISSYFVSYEYSALSWMWTIIEVQLLNWIMKIKLVNISLSPIVEVCKKKHSFKKMNFK